MLETGKIKTMKKELKDYLHLYLGCEVHSLDGGSMKYTLSGIDLKGNALFYDGAGNEVWLARWKIVLRPLSDITDEEELEIEGEFGSYGLGENHLCNALKSHDLRYVKKLDEGFELTRYLLSKHFDLFGLIEAGLAIDKTTM